MEEEAELNGDAYLPCMMQREATESLEAEDELEVGEPALGSDHDAKYRNN